MKQNNWENDIKIWTSKKKKVQAYNSALTDFFRIAFDNTYYPEKSYFGTNTGSISLTTGQIHLAAYTSKGHVWLLLDKKVSGIPRTFSRILRDNNKFSQPLFWFYTSDLNNIALIINRKDIWESFRVASKEIFESNTYITPLDRVINNKVLLSKLWMSAKKSVPILTVKEIEISLQKEIEKARELSPKQRQSMIKKSNRKPERMTVIQTVFKRNPYVIIEVLARAKGICEKCKKPAPFIGDHNRTPYLEVHHKIPLAENGDDSVDNAIALCPNCHRHAHHGKQSY